MRKTALLLAAAAAALSVSAVQEAKSGPGAILRLVNMRAAGSPKAFSDAAEAVARDAAAGHPLQQYVIALVQNDAFLPPAARLDLETRQRYLDSARGRIRALAEKRNNAFAWYLLSLESGDMTLLRRAAEGGNVQALNAWGTIMLTKTLGSASVSSEETEMAVERSFSCFKRAAGENDANGLYNLGMCYMRGYGCPENPSKALECFRAAAESGHTEAIISIGGMYRDGVVVDQDSFVAAKWFERSSDAGNAYGQFNYALMLLRGEGVGKDEARAASLFLESAGQGCVESIEAYGACLADGIGVERDAAAAVAWFKRAAGMGYAPAMERLADCYERGAGGLVKSAKESTVWKIRARAARGDRHAIAWLSQNGYGMR